MFFEGKLAPPPMITFNKDGHTATIDIVDGVLVYSGDVDVSVAAKDLFRALVPYVNDEWLERAASKVK